MLILLFSVLTLDPAAVTGKWQGSIAISGAAEMASLDLYLDKGKLKGTFTLQRAKKVTRKIRLKLKGDELQFTVPNIERIGYFLKGTIKGDQLVGLVSYKSSVKDNYLPKRCRFVMTKYTKVSDI